MLYIYMSSNYLLYMAVILFCLILFCPILFPWKEGLVSNPKLIESIVLTKNVPVTKIQIEYAGALMTTKEDSWLNLNDMTIYDNNGTKVEYWKGKNQVKFLKINKGILTKYRIEHLWDEDDTTVQSSVAPETLSVQFGNGIEGIYLDSIVLTNRKDCCETRIQNYKLVLYNTTEIIGSISLVQLGEKGKTVKYKVIPPLRGLKGETGDKGDKGERGEVGLQGIQGIQGKEGERGIIGDTSYLSNPSPFIDIFHTSFNSEKP